MYGLKVNTGPATEPVTTAEAKAHLNIESAETYWDSQIDDLVTMARETFEDDTDIALINRTVEYRFSKLPANGIIRLPASPLQSITSFQIRTAQATFDTFTDYEILQGSQPPAIRRNLDASWPSQYGFTHDCRIIFVAGYGATAADVPEGPKHAIKLLVGHWFTNREAIVARKLTHLPLAYKHLVNQYSAGDEFHQYNV